MHPVTLIAVVSASVGLSLVALGFRGRRLDRLPRCRACSYNLTGVSAGRCPECGRALSGRRAVRRGLRRRRPFCLAAGAIVLAGLSVPALWWQSGRGPIGSRPAWRLLAEIRLWPAGAAESGQELRRRWEQGELRAGEERAYLNAIVSSWEDRRHASPLRDPDLFEAAYISAALSRDQLRTVFEAAMDELRDDDVAGNAAQGERIVRLLAPLAQPAIEEALASEDAQQALRAARIAEVTSDMRTIEAPPERLLAHAATALEAGAEWGVSRDAERVLRASGERARAQLESAIYSADPRQAFRAARLLSSLGENESHHHRLLELAIESLRDDDIQHNTWWGSAYLAQHAREADLARLERVLSSADDQQRAEVLDALVWVHRRLGVPPGRATLVAWTSALRSESTVGVAAPVSGLSHDMDAAEPHLRGSLDSSDARERFLAACLLAWDGRLGPGEPAIDALVAQLADNNAGGDSAFAAAALYRLGEPARPALRRALESADVQQRNEAAEILWAWTLEEDQPAKYNASPASYAQRVRFPQAP